VGGNQPGEPRETRELGVESPKEGLYLREDVEIICHLALASFVKKEMKTAARIMVDRMTRKPELLDRGVLDAMFEEGKLKTSNANVQSRNSGRPPRCDTWRTSVEVSSVGSEPSLCESPEHKYTTYSDLVCRQENIRTTTSRYFPPVKQEGYEGPECRHEQSSQAYADPQNCVHTLSRSPITQDEAQDEDFLSHAQRVLVQSTAPRAPTIFAELADTSVRFNELKAGCVSPKLDRHASAQLPTKVTGSSLALLLRDDTLRTSHPFSFSPSR
jgi:hypothetical protein